MVHVSLDSKKSKTEAVKKLVQISENAPCNLVVAMPKGKPALQKDMESKKPDWRKVVEYFAQKGTTSLMVIMFLAIVKFFFIDWLMVCFEECL